MTKKRMLHFKNSQEKSVRERLNSLFDNIGATGYTIKSRLDEHLVFHSLKSPS